MSLAARVYKVASGNPKTTAETLYDRNQDLLERCVLAACGFTGLLPHQWEDACSHARIGLWNAALRYDPARGAAFPSFAWWQIRGELSHYFRTLERMRERCEIELDAPLAGGDSTDGDLTRRDLLADDPAERPGEALLAAAGFEALVEVLPCRQEACAPAVPGRGAADGAGRRMGRQPGRRQRHAHAGLEAGSAVVLRGVRWLFFALCLLACCPLNAPVKTHYREHILTINYAV